MAKPQESIDQIWAKYRKSLTALVDAVEENESLKQELNINFDMPADIAELEKKVEDRLANYEPKE